MAAASKGVAATSAVRGILEQYLDILDDLIGGCNANAA